MGAINPSLQVKQIPSLSKLISSKTLRSLSLRKNTLGDKGLRRLLSVLMKSESLCSLNVSDNLVTDKSLPYVAEFIGHPSGSL